MLGRGEWANNLYLLYIFCQAFIFWKRNGLIWKILIKIHCSLNRTLAIIVIVIIFLELDEAFNFDKGEAYICQAC